MGLSIIIVNYNVCHEVENCLNSLYSEIRNTEFEVIVVDNNSIQRDIEDLKSKYPKVRFIFQSENLGYAKANNSGAKISKFDTILFLNPDTLVAEDFVAPILKFIEDNTNAGACGPRLLNPDGSYQNSAGPRMGFLYETAEAFMVIGLFRCAYNILKGLKKCNTEPVKVGWVSGACLMIKKEIFEDVGGFSEEFFLNYEDIDLCRKTENAGYSNFYFPGLSCIHIDQSSQKKNYENLVFTRYQSRRIFGNKNYSFLTKCFINFMHIAGIIIRLGLVHVIYRGDEMTQRKRGYKKSLNLYLR